MKKLLLVSGVVASLAFAASNALAVMQIFTLSGTATIQSEDAHNFDLMKSHGVTQKDLLFFLEQATGDTSITNKHVTTKIYYDPDAEDFQAYDSNEGIGNGGSLPTFYGIFYYSNSVAGRVQLDGEDIFGDYYSYIELDYWNAIYGRPEGFWNPYAMETDFLETISDSELNYQAKGNATLYVHSTGDEYDLLSVTGGVPYFYVANDNYGIYNTFSATIHGRKAVKHIHGYLMAPKLF